MNSKLKLSIMAVAVAGFAATSARASIEYFEWVPDPVGNVAISSGTFELNGTSIIDFSFSEDHNPNADTAFNGTFTTLADGDLVLNGRSTGGSEGTGGGNRYTSWAGQGASGSGNEDVAAASIWNGAYDDFYGDWRQYTPVPEPSTLISGVLMVLPFGGSALRILRRRQTA